MIKHWSLNRIDLGNRLIRGPNCLTSTVLLDFKVCAVELWCMAGEDRSLAVGHCMDISLHTKESVGSTNRQII